MQIMLYTPKYINHIEFISVREGLLLQLPAVHWCDYLHHSTTV